MVSEDEAAGAATAGAVVRAVPKLACSTHRSKWSIRASSSRTRATSLSEYAAAGNAEEDEEDEDEEDGGPFTATAAATAVVPAAATVAVGGAGAMVAFNEGAARRVAAAAVACAKGDEDAGVAAAKPRPLSEARPARTMATPLPPLRIICWYCTPRGPPPPPATSNGTAAAAAEVPAAAGGRGAELS
jgi:hypothetical protein